MTVNLSKKNLLHAVYLVLLLAILGLLIWSQPWKTQSSAEIRKVTVNGQATVESEPDVYTFNPYFEVKSTDQAEAKAEISKLANEAVEKIKELGVDENNISLDASSYDRWYWSEGEEGILNAYITVKVSDKDLAQKIQDYLAETEAKGQLTSTESFSEEKKKQLENQVTDKAIADAREKAEAQARLLGAELGEVIEVSQDDGFNAMPFRGGIEVQALDAQGTSLPVLPGQQEYSKTVQVTYELK